MPEKPPFDQLPPEDPRSGANTLRVENQALAKGFTLIPNVILRARGISRDAKMLYSILLSYAWQTDSCFPGYDTLMEDMQCGRPQVAKYIRELKDAGLIAVQRRGQGMTSIYTLKDIQGAEIQKFQNETSSSSNIELQEVSDRNSNNTHRKIHKEKDSNSRIATATRTASEGIKGGQNAAFSTIRRINTSDFRGEEREPEPATPRKTRGGISPVADLLPKSLPRRAGRPTVAETSLREQLMGYVTDFAAEFSDRATLKQSLTRAVNLMQRSGYSLDAFVAAMYTARAKTKENQANIRAEAVKNDKNAWPQKPKMQYFFAILEEEVGLRGRDDDRGSGDD